MTALPTHWASVLPHLDFPIPGDRMSQSARPSDGLTTTLPLELVRQSRLARERWPIPPEVLEEYRRYRPTPLWRAERFEAEVGAKVPIFVKYEGGNLAGSHKLNSALPQAFYYRAAGREELVTGTGAGQWGTALAAACRVFGLKCTVFMSDDSLRRKPDRRTLMTMLGARVVATPSEETELGRACRGKATNGLTHAIGEAAEYAAARETCGFVTGSGETYTILHQSVIGLEAIEQLEEAGATPDVVVGSVGAGSNFGGIGLPFVVRAANDGRARPALVAAESDATPKLTRGVYAYDHTDAGGRGPMEAMYTVGSALPVRSSHAAGLRFHGVSKVLSAMRHHGEIASVALDQRSAMEAGMRFTVAEGVIPAPEAGHALAAAARIAAGGDDPVASRKGMLVCLSGHGYHDMSAYHQFLAGELPESAPSPEEVAAAVAGLELVDGAVGSVRA